MRVWAIWGALAFACLTPIALAATSPLLAWRDPIYIASGIAGIIGFVLILVQPLLASGLLPLPKWTARRVHRALGLGLVLAVVLHIAGLWITSPPDVIDVLLLSSPTPFSLWGVIAMWALFAAASLAVLRRRIALNPMNWRRLHTGLVALVIVGTIVHVLLIEGTMEPLSKIALSAFAAFGFCVALWRADGWRRSKR